MTTTNYRSSSRNKSQRQETKRSRAAAKPSLERLEDRLAMAGFGPEDGSYILEPSQGSYSSVRVLSGDRIVAAAPNTGIISRYDSQGNLDAAFGSGGLAQTGIIGGGGLSIQPDGKLVMPGGGDATNSARLNANGSRDSTYGTGGVSASLDITPGNWDKAFASGIQSNGKIIVAGGSMTSSSGISAVVARYKASGAVDSGKGGFGQPIKGSQTAGYTVSSFGGNTSIKFVGLAVQPDDKIVAVGTLQTNPTPTTTGSRLVIARYTASGALDTTFNKTGYPIFLPAGITETTGSAVSIQTDGKITVSGSAVGADGTYDLLVARYNTTGTLDGSFGGGKGYVTFDTDGAASPTNESASSLLIQPDGKIVAAGYVSPKPGRPNVLVTRFNTDGTLDNGFGAGGFKVGSAPTGHEQLAYGVALQSDGSIIVGGLDTDYSSTPNLRNALLMRFYGGNTAPAVPAASTTTTTAAATDALMAMFDLDDPILAKRKKL